VYDEENSVALALYISFCVQKQKKQTDRTDFKVFLQHFQAEGALLLLSPR